MTLRTWKEVVEAEMKNLKIKEEVISVHSKCVTYKWSSMCCVLFK